MELNLIARNINFYSIKAEKLQKVEKILSDIAFKFQMSGYYKYNFLIYNYKKEGCFLTYYEGLDLDDKAQVNLNCKSKFSTLTYPTGDKQDFLYQVEVINTLSQNLNGYIYDPKTKRVITASEVKFLF